MYFDHAATTPLDPRVLSAMMPFLTDDFGNPSSVHQRGRRARFAVEESRERIAAAIGAQPSEIIFTSGGTEADNLALRGCPASGALVTSAAEHEAVLRTAETMQKEGRRVRILQPDAEGAVSTDFLLEQLPEDAGLVSLMHANNEVGTLTDIGAVADVCYDRGVLVHTDAVQTAGVLPLNVAELNVDLLSASAHKFYGPKGIGFLFVGGGTNLHPTITGGAQERRRRGGTENVAAIVGMAEALDIARQEAEERLPHYSLLRRTLIDALDATFGDGYRLNSPRDGRRALPSIVNISFPAGDGQPIDGEMLLLNLDMAGVLVSAGSACTSGALEPSHVLRAMGVHDATARASVRFSFGKDNSVEEVEQAVEVLGRIVTRMRRAAA